MSKKAFIGTLSVLALFGMACLCMPGILFPLEQAPGRTPAPRASATPAQPTVAEGDIPACVQKLDRTLEEAENGSVSGEELSQEYTLANYVVAGDTLSDPSYPPVPSRVQAYQDDVAAQEKIWAFVVDVIPADQRTEIDQFRVFTDGAGGTLGAVEQADDPQHWRLEMDLVDGGNFPDLSTTLIHEFGHLLTLNDAQVTTDLLVFNNPDDDPIYQQEQAACSTYFVSEGCSRPDSYLNTFFHLFWPDIYSQWLAIDREQNDQTYEDKLDAFYQEYAVQFVSSYAVTSPAEDIAESFMYFIFSPKPSGLTVADQKVLFFYGYPEMVDLRQRILEHLCTYVP